MDNGAFVGVFGLPIVAGLAIGGLVFVFGLVAAANFAVTRAISRAAIRRRDLRRIARSTDLRIHGETARPESLTANVAERDATRSGIQI